MTISNSLPYVEQSTEIPYTELHCHSYYSLLDGASSPEALIARADELGMTSMAITDHDSLGGAVRFWAAARRKGIHAVIGAEITLDDASHLTLLAETQQGYANLCRLITASRLDTTAPRPDEVDEDAWTGKVDASLDWSYLDTNNQGLIALTGCRKGLVSASLLQYDNQGAQAALGRLVDIFGRDNVYVELQNHMRAGDDVLIPRLVALARAAKLPVVATNNLHYATRRGAMLHDALNATYHNKSLAEMRYEGLLSTNSNRFLATAQEMVVRFQELPEALENTNHIAERCQVSLDFSNQRLPRYPTPNGQDEFDYLYELCNANLHNRYKEVTPKILKQLVKELDVIEQAGLAGYFLIVWDIVNYSRSQGIRCQGRGSAANSIVAYLLQITSIDPLRHNLLFERFLSKDKFTTPDIDVDFAADRREEVIQYVYRRYGAEHTAMVCNAVTYRARSALRDMGKALDFPLPVVEGLLKTLETRSPKKAAEQIMEALTQDQGAAIAAATQAFKEEEGLVGPVGPSKADNPEDTGQASADADTSDIKESSEREDGTDEFLDMWLSAPVNGNAAHPIALLAELMRQIDGCPRHLSIHSGGMLITGLPLNEVVPLEPATMPGRVVCQWDKDCVEDAGLIKLDLLALRTLGVISEALEHIEESGVQVPDMDALPMDDPLLYDMLQRGDTIGTFQVESRAQQQMLPRLKPANFEDIIIQVSIVRPGPIQGGSVHPYLRRRNGIEPTTYIHPCLEPVLEETKGVLLFQEQAIRVSVAAAGFSPGKADVLRRALNRKRSDEAMEEMYRLFLEGAQAKGIDLETAKAIFVQLAGFAGYGLCKSHAAAFALIAYQTLYLKQYHPAAFYCGLFNQQPMGFYSVEVLAGDAARHGVDLLPLHIDLSDWAYKPECDGTSKHVNIRTGLRAVSELGEQTWELIQAAREQDLAPFRSLEDFCRRTRLPRDNITSLIRAGVFDHMDTRRQLLWHFGEIDYHASDDLQLPATRTPVELPQLAPLEQMQWEYELLGLSTDGQIMSLYRKPLRESPATRDVLSTWEVKRQVKKYPRGRRVRVAGMIVVRQQPATAKGIMFLSLEDESGLLDLVIKSYVYSEVREVMRQTKLVLAQGVIQRGDGAVSVLVERMVPLVS